MTQVLRGNIIQAPRLGELDIREHGYLVLEDGVVQGVYDALPQALASAPITDYGDRLIMQSFVDMHLHAPQYPMLGMGMDLPLLDWLNTYTFRTEARFADPDFARRTYRRLASDLITNGTTRVCMFSSVLTEATWILMEELERAGISDAVIDPVTVKPLDEALIRSWAKKTGIVVTAENHNRIGGLTSAVQAAVCGMPLRFGVVAVEDCFGEVGPQSYLQERFGLTAGHIVQTTKAALDLPRRQ